MPPSCSLFWLVPLITNSVSIFSAMHLKLILAIATSCAIALTCLPAANAATQVVPTFSVSVTAKAIGKARAKKSLVQTIRIRSTGLSRATPQVKCDSRKCKRSSRKGKARTNSRSNSVTFSNVRWLLPRGKTFTVVVNRRGYIGRYVQLKRKPGSFTQFQVVKAGCTSKGFKRRACPPVAPSKRCARNAAHQSGTTEAGSAARKLSAGDFNGDGRDDVGLAYHYGVSSGLFAFYGQPNVSVEGRRDYFGVLDWTKVRLSAGDLNGDCVSDIALVLDRGSGNIELLTSDGSSAGLSPTLRSHWISSSGSWNWSSIKQLAGDFNGDEIDDILLLQSVGGGVHMSVMAGSPGGLGAPQSVWTGVGWSLGELDAVSGDFNNDGRDELGVFHSRGAGQGVNLWRFSQSGTWFGDPQLGWVSDVSWELSKIRALTGDFDGDGFDDIEIAYEPEPQRVTLHRMRSTGAALDPPSIVWDSGPGNWDLNAVKFASADLNGDGKSELTGLYNYGPGSARFWTFLTSIASPVVSWYTGTGWEWGHVQ